MTTLEVGSKPKANLGVKPVDRNILIAGVTIVAMVTTAVTVLIALGKDTTALLTVIGLVVVPLLAALGYGKLQGIEQRQHQQQQQTNGTQTEMLSMIRDSLDKLARAEPIAPSAAEEEDARRRV